MSGVLVAGVGVVDPWGLAPFGPAKVAVLTVGLLAAATALAGRPVLVDRRMALGWLALLGWMAIAAVRAVDPLHAWVGTPDRRFGWLAWALLAVSWYCGRAVEGERDRRLLLRGAALAAGVLGLYTAAELLGITPGTGGFAGGRLGGPYGQPAYLGAAGVLLTPVAVGLAADRREVRGWRLVAAAAAGLGMMAVLGSQTRGAWVGAVVACLPLLPRAWRAARRKPTAAALLLAGVTAAVALTPVGARVASVAEIDGTARGRVDEWRTAAAALDEAPVLGYGPEGYRVAFPGVVDAAYARAHGRDVIPDRAHNGVLDVAVTGGVPAAAAYLVLLSVVVAGAWRGVRGVDPAVVGLAVGVLAYALQQQLLFPLLETDPAFWLLAGALGTAVAPHTTRSPRMPATLAAGLGTAAAAALLAGGLEVVADRSLRDAASAGPVGRVASLADADRAVALRPDSIRGWYIAARVAARGPGLTDLDAALDRIEAGLAVSPADPALRTERSRLLLERAQRSVLPEDLARAVADLQVLVADDPAHPAHRLRLASALGARGDLRAADVQLAAAEDLAPRSAVSSLQRARLALQRGDLPAAAAAAERARSRDPQHPQLSGLVADIEARTAPR